MAAVLLERWGFFTSAEENLSELLNELRGNGQSAVREAFKVARAPAGAFRARCGHNVGSKDVVGLCCCSLQRASSTWSGTVAFGCRKFLLHGLWACKGTRKGFQRVGWGAWRQAVTYDVQCPGGTVEWMQSW
jgi:hypothetical protein